MLRHPPFIDQDLQSAIIYRYALGIIVLGLVLVANTLVLNGTWSIAAHQMIIPGSLIVAGLVLQRAASLKITQLQLLIIFGLIALFYVQSFFNVEATKVGVGRYYIFICLLILLPLYLSNKALAISYIAFFVLQVLRNVAIAYAWIEVPISNWPATSYISTITILSIMVYVIFDVIFSRYKERIQDLRVSIQKNTQTTTELQRLKVAQENHYRDERRIFDGHYEQIQLYIEQAEALIEANASPAEWHSLCEHIDRELKEVNRLTDQPKYDA